LQKWGNGAGEPSGNYPIFMATSQRPGKDNSGDYIYKTNEVGDLIDEEGNRAIESGHPPAVDHDLDEIAEAFRA